jgi:hypothetical protein
VNSQRSHLLLFYFAAAILIFSGCAPQQRKPMPVCPGKESVAEAISVLMSRAQNMVPLKANGQCLLEYYVEGKKHKENFPVKLWVNPPAEVYLQGDIAFNPRGLVLGSNEREFWLSIRPEEISSYWWGLWSEGGYNEKLVISPKIMLEALGTAAADSNEPDEKNWSLSKENGFDVLTNRSDGGQVIKKLYISNCDYLVRRIEYFYTSGETMVTAELEEYKEVLKGIFVPAAVKITTRAGVNRGDSVKIALDSVKKAEFPEKLRNRIFTRPDPQGFKHIYKVIDGNIIEQNEK